MKKRKQHMSTQRPAVVLLLVFCMLAAVAAQARESGADDPIVLESQGSFAVGGTVVTAPGTYTPFSRDPEGQTYHGDHAYVFYQVPKDAHMLPMVMWHGFGQFSKTWESTPDGREGYQNIFLRLGYGVYLFNQPRRGNAGRTTSAAPVSTQPNEQFWFNMFRVGVWPEYYPGVQFPRDADSLEQYFRQMTPDTGPIDIHVNSDAVAALFERIGQGILVTHSHSGGMGWDAVLKSPNIRAVASYEPGSNFIFPEGEMPEPVKSEFGDLKAASVSLSDFMKLTRIPIVIYYGDNIPDAPSTDLGKDQWRIRLIMARKWAEAVNRHGGDVTVVHLPEAGIHGNTHFPFSDTNNLAVADLLSEWLHAKGLDQ